MIIEHASLEDAPAVLALQKIAYRSEAEQHNDDTLPPLTQTLEGIQDDFEKMTALKASAGDRIVGSVRAYIVEDTCFVGRLVVHPDFQNQGIATRLMREIESRFDRARRFELFTGHKSDPALRLYRKLGYTEFNGKDMPTHTLVFLEKRTQ